VPEQFKGFDDAVFDAFEPRKWSSNIFNMERMEVRARLRALGSLLEPVLTATRPMQWDVTPHMPNIFNAKSVREMVLYFTRTDAEKKAISPLLDKRISLPDQISDAGEHHRHVTLGVRVCQTGMDVGLMMHSTAWLDVMNLLNRCRESFELSKFVGHLQGLPEGVTFRITPKDEVPVGQITVEHLHKLENAVLNEQFLIVIGRHFDRTDAVVRDAPFVQTCRQLLGALLPVWEFIAWRSVSDYLDVAKDAKRAKVAAEAAVADIALGSKVRITEGLFAGREGVVTELNFKGNVKILLGKITVLTEGRCLKVM